MTVSINGGEIPLSVRINNDFPDRDTKVEALRAIGYLTADSMRMAELDPRSNEAFDVVLARDVTPPQVHVLLDRAGVQIV